MFLNCVRDSFLPRRDGELRTDRIKVKLRSSRLNTEAQRYVLGR